jgi:hypothetical protein
MMYNFFDKCFCSLEQQLEIYFMRTKELNILNLINVNKLIKFNHSYIICWLNDDKDNQKKSEVIFIII